MNYRKKITLAEPLYYNRCDFSIIGILLEFLFRIWFYDLDFFVHFHFSFINVVVFYIYSIYI